MSHLESVTHEARISYVLKYHESSGVVTHGVRISYVLKYHESSGVSGLSLFLLWVTQNMLRYTIVTNLKGTFWSNREAGLAHKGTRD